VDVRGLLFIQLHTLRSHYLTIVITTRGFKHALIGIHNPTEGPDSVFLIKDFGWIDPRSLILHHENHLNSLRDSRDLPTRVPDSEPSQASDEVPG
jgi:hypothetical protein